MDMSKLGTRELFRGIIIAAVIFASLSVVAVTFVTVTHDERASAEASMRSEINYLCLQLESLGNHVDAFNQLASATGLEPQELGPESLESHRLLSDPIGNVLSGYTLAETGTVVIIADGTVMASDDARVPVGSDVRELLGDEVHVAIDASLRNDQFLTVPYRGVFDEPGGAGSYGDGDDEAILIARQQGDYTVMIMEPMSMVLKKRSAFMGREFTISFAILVAVGIIADFLLSRVARRIEKTNEVLERITSGDLEARVEEKGTLEFVSLAADINATVEALQGWIAEAEMRLDSELEAARAIQESALPRTFPPYPEISKFDLYAIMDAAREVGGDFYDFFLVGESGPDSGKVAFLVADVSGKGVPAALFMMEAKAQVRRELQSGMELSQAIETASRALAEGNSTFTFVTMWVGVLDYETGRVEYVNAGHNPPLLWQEKTGWSQLKNRSGLPLGLPISHSYSTYSLDCSAGGKLLLYTDGVTEAKSEDDERYGDARLADVANASAGEHPEALVKAVRRDVASFARGAEQFDDITILALEIGAQTPH